MALIIPISNTFVNIWFVPDWQAVNKKISKTANKSAHTAILTQSLRNHLFTELFEITKDKIRVSDGN